MKFHPLYIYKVAVSNFFFHPYLGKWSNLTNIFKWVETTNQYIYIYIYIYIYLKYTIHNKGQLLTGFLWVHFPSSSRKCVTWWLLVPRRVSQEPLEHPWVQCSLPLRKAHRTWRVVSSWAMKKTLVCWGYIGDDTTQLYRDFKKNMYGKDPD